MKTTRPGRVAPVLAATAAVLAACGLPGDGSVRAVDDDTVPYRLLESSTPTTPPSSFDSRPGSVPVVFWLAGDRLVPEATDFVCTESPAVLIEGLLDALATGPSEEARSAGRSSAVPPDPGLDLIELADGRVEVDIEPETSLSAERLPVAVGQVVLTLTSAPTVRSVLLVANGKEVKVPLPDGALTNGPVTAEDYADLLPDRLTTPRSFGCARP
ncbi:GerMN domain-containing protein [Nocardioides sp. YIM 152315]|uniref:GerMN domain-containing protein n=1 Tax=Nocardioides sp. YIM 152315 TaxID=3031760 RepID=UPI0023DADC7A|nr:GerMN domain-containing protein [Nocardioides sp. YIM 152315]MDF1605794.1 GerMN domain-containing protein [Nocardioides sp. YIM 152315]